MKCPKCKGLMVYEAPRWEGDTPAGRCVNCGNHIFKPAFRFPMRREVPPRSEPVMKKCATEGCHTTIDTRCNNGGLCKACRKVLALQEQIARLQMRRTVPLAERRAAN